VRSHIDSLLPQFGKSWIDLVELLSNGATVSLPPSLAANIIGLSDPDPARRAAARQGIMELLARRRMTWNDLTDLLIGITSAPPSTDDPPRVNPLELVIHLINEYVALQPHETLAVALWILHSHIFGQFMVTPRLVWRSVVANCGKTTLLDVMSKLVAMPEKVDSITTAALFRLIDRSRPTMLIDEADNLMLSLQGNSKLLAVVNSGHRQGGTVTLSERGLPRKFTTFAPLALALPNAAGGLPRTLNSRCITIHLERSTRKLKRFSTIRPDYALDEGYQQILLWRADVKLNDDPLMPEGLNNRIADNWRVLISIADSLGWGEQAREAAVIFARALQDADARILLLTDIRTLFNADGGHDRMTSAAILDALHGLDDADWCEFRGVRGDQAPHKLKASELALMLREFSIRPRTIWPPNRTAQTRSSKGYYRCVFENAWRAYCTDDGTAAHSRKSRGLHLVGDDTGDDT
jgi:hypothetical protein